MIFLRGWGRIKETGDMMCLLWWTLRWKCKIAYMFHVFKSGGSTYQKECAHIIFWKKIPPCTKCLAKNYNLLHTCLFFLFYFLQIILREKKNYYFFPPKRLDFKVKITSWFRLVSFSFTAYQPLLVIWCQILFLYIY